MAKKLIIPLPICTLILSMLCAATRAETDVTLSENIHILPDGTVTPSTAPIHRNGDTYQLTNSLVYESIIVEKNNISLDGRGYTMQGNGIGKGVAAINLTCTGVTVRNFQINDYEVGILGACDGNRIVGNDFTDVGISIAVYASNYEIKGNFLEYVRIVGANMHIYNNEITVRDYQSGFWVSNCTNLTVEANNIKFTNKTTSFISLSGNNSVNVYHNNFLNPEALQFSRGQFYLFGMSGISDLEPWDNGRSEARRVGKECRSRWSPYH